MSAPSGPRTILVVDDDKDMLNLLRLHLGNAGYTVVLSEDAVDAGYKILRKPPDLMIVDVNMPYMGGVDFVATLTSDRSVATFPIIFLTARDDVDERAQILGARCLTKPIGADVLLAEVAKALAGPAD
jgi:DNA-binding response OmpR family regulator